MLVRMMLSPHAPWWIAESVYPRRGLSEVVSTGLLERMEESRRKWRIAWEIFSLCEEVVSGERVPWQGPGREQEAIRRRIPI